MEDRDKLRSKGGGANDGGSARPSTASGARQAESAAPATAVELLGEERRDGMTRGIARKQSPN